MKELPTAQVFTTSQLSDRLGLGTSMARRYGLAYEEVTGQPIPQAPGRGRLYSEDAVSTLEKARDYLLTHPGETVEGALRAVLGLEVEPQEVESEPTEQAAPRLTVEAFRRELEQALKPVLAELQTLREENEELREAVQGLRALPGPSEASEGAVSDPETLAELEEQRRLNAYLKGEIVRRDLEAERVNKPWWKWW